MYMMYMHMHMHMLGVATRSSIYCKEIKSFFFFSKYIIQNYNV